jgi:hypothetical protein
MKHFNYLFKLTFILVGLAGTLTNMNAQGVGIGTTDPDSSAILDLTSTSKGVLVPRMTSMQRVSISNAAIGLLVFDTVTESFWFNGTAGWSELREGKV